MSACLKIISPGMMASVQDKGRFGFGSFGVPRSGAIDPISLRLGNALVGNGPYEAAIEFRLMGPTLTAENGPVRIGLACYATAELTVFLTGEAQAISPWQSITLQEGDILKISPLLEGATGYVTIEGGLDLSPVLTSCSTYARAKMGMAVQAGDRLPVNQDAMPRKCEIIITDPPESTNDPLHVIFGPQDDYFSPDELNAFCSNGFKVSADVDRMGIRLEGTKVNALPEKGYDLISDGLVAGAIQIPGNGQPIILCVDCQSVGGYPKIATVVSADLHRLGQMMPGQKVRFKAVDLKKAQALRLDLEQSLQKSIGSLQDYYGEGVVNVDALHGANLIGGVVDAQNPGHFPGHLEDDT